MGKIPEEYMDKYVYRRLGVWRDDVIVASSPGLDVSVTKINGEKVLVSHVDPIVGALEKIGWLAVHIACNDIATSGARPRWIIPLILLPERWSPDMLDKITYDIDTAAKELGLSIIGGHTGYAPGLNRPLVSVTAFGIGIREDILLSSMAKPGDAIIVTKGIGLEGTAILAGDFKEILISKGVSSKCLEDALKYLGEISVVNEAVALAKSHMVHAMHDATRGGVAEAIFEMAYASKVLIEVYEDKMPVRRETRIFAETLDFNPMWMISSGTLVLSIPKENVNKVQEMLIDIGVSSSVVGEVVKRSKPTLIIHRRDGDVYSVDKLQPDRDELAELWRRYPRI